jgi:Tannase and feruloyl esterase
MNAKSLGCFSHTASAARSWRLWVAMLAVVATAIVAATAKPARASLAVTAASNAAVAPTPAEQCAALGGLSLPLVTSTSATLVTSGTFTPSYPPPFNAPVGNLPEFCRVALVVEPQINIEVWLPTSTYNGRFQAVGGGGYAGTISYGAMGSAIRAGYATASTDTGHSAFTQPGGSFALNADGTLNDQLIEDFARRSLVELTEKAKTLVRNFYGGAPSYSYWNGCSTGGRQGLMLAQVLPQGYDGIFAGAPAINWDRFIPAELWPQVVMQNDLGAPIAQCKLTAASNAAVAACDNIDGVTDGVLEDPRQCNFDPTTLVGTSTACGTITAADARVIAKIWAGARGTDGSFLWYGLSRGAPLNALGGTSPFPIAVDHFRYWIEQNPAFDWKTLSYSTYEQDFRRSQDLFNRVIGTDDPNLQTFRALGHKLIMWHGWNDQLIFPQGSIDYYSRVLEFSRNAQPVQSWARLFMAPGMFHCAGGTGPSSFDGFGALVNWVENGVAPDRIIVSGGTPARTRPLCPYPQVSNYNGSGNTNDAANFTCRTP